VATDYGDAVLLNQTTPLPELTATHSSTLDEEAG